MFSFVLYSIVAIIFILLSIIINRFNYWTKRGIRQDEPIRVHKHFADYNTLVDLYRRHKLPESPFVGLFLYIRPVALLTNLDLIEKIFITNFDSFDQRATYYNDRHDLMSVNIGAMHGPVWKHCREKLISLYNVPSKESIFYRLLSVGASFEDRLGHLSSLGVEIDIMDLASRFSMDMIITWVYGFECNTLYDRNRDITHHGRKFFLEPELSDSLLYLCIAFGSVGRKFKRRYISPDVGEFFSKMTIIRLENIDKRRHASNYSDIMGDVSGLKNKKNAIQRLCAIEFELFCNAYDTLATLLTFVMYELAHNIDIQDTARSKIKTVLKSNKGCLTVNALKDMRYLDLIIKETLRKYPSVPHLSRIAQENYRVPGHNNMVIEKGTIVYVSTYAIHNDPEIYPDPHKFNPNRFLAGNILRRHKASFLGFGLGKKSCFLQELAMIEAKIAIVAALNNFKYTLGPSTNYPRTFQHFSVCKNPLPHIYLNVTEIPPS